MDNYNRGGLGIVSIYYFKKWVYCKEREIDLGKSDEEVKKKCQESYSIYIDSKNRLLKSNENLSKIIYKE